MPRIFNSSTIRISSADIRIPSSAINVPPFLAAGLAINNKHAQLGGDTGFLGGALESMGNCPDGIGFFRRYVNGMIYFTPSTGAQEVHGRILDKWSSLGFERSFLGYPLHDEMGTPDGIGRFNRFQGGMIYWTPSTDAHEIHGAILEKWEALGFERSFLGYPITDELDIGVNGGRFSNFQLGQIAWSSRSGAAVSAATKANVGVGIRLQGLGQNGQPVVRRIVVASAHMDITDDETFGSNEHATAFGQDQGFVSGGQPSTVLKLIGKCGGEVRVELEVIASGTVEGDLQISGTVKLFEGTSEETDDLDGTTSINFTVPRDGFIQKNLNVRNADEGGDFADIRLAIANQAA